MRGSLVSFCLLGFHKRWSLRVTAADCMPLRAQPPFSATLRSTGSFRCGHHARAAQRTVTWGQDGPLGQLTDVARSGAEGVRLARAQPWLGVVNYDHAPRPTTGVGAGHGQDVPTVSPGRWDAPIFCNWFG